MRRRWFEFLRRHMTQDNQPFEVTPDEELDEAKRESEALRIRMEDAVQRFEAEVALMRLTRKERHGDHPSS